MPPAPPSDRELDAYREQADRFIAELDEEFYLHYAGHKETFELAPIYERHRNLTELETVKSIGHISRLQHIEDNNADEVAPRDMLKELLQDNQRLAEEMLKLHTLCDEEGDVASASLIEVWIDEAQGRAWFLREAVQPG